MLIPKVQFHPKLAACLFLTPCVRLGRRVSQLQAEQAVRIVAEFEDTVSPPQPTIQEADQGTHFSPHCDQGNPGGYQERA